MLAGDVNPPPSVLIGESPATKQSDADVSIDSYFSRAWHEREIEQIWRKAWQLACRVEDRTGDSGIKAYINPIGMALQSLFAGRLARAIR